MEQVYLILGNAVLGWLIGYVIGWLNGHAKPKREISEMEKYLKDIKKELKEYQKYIRKIVEENRR